MCDYSIFKLWIHIDVFQREMCRFPPITSCYVLAWQSSSDDWHGTGATPARLAGQ